MCLLYMTSVVTNKESTMRRPSMTKGSEFLTFFWGAKWFFVLHFHTLNLPEVLPRELSELLSPVLVSLPSNHRLDCMCNCRTSATLGDSTGMSFIRYLHGINVALWNRFIIGYLNFGAGIRVYIKVRSAIELNFRGVILIALISG